METKNKYFFEGSIDIRIFRDFMSNIRASFCFMIEKVVFKFKPDGIYLTAIDSSHVGIGTCRLHKNEFETYKLVENSDIGINIKILSKILKKTGSTKDKQKENPEIVIKARSESMIFKYGRRIKELKSCVIDVDENEENITEIFEEALKDNFVGNFKIKTKKITEIINESSDLYDLAKFTQDQTKIIISSDDEDIKDRVVINKSDEIITEYENDGIVNFTCSLDFLNMFLKEANKLGDTVQFKLGKNCPGMLVIEFGDSSWFKYLLAPRVMDDEDQDQDQDEYLDESEDQDETF